MTKLPQPTWAKRWATIGEVAESWGWTVQDLLDFACQGKLELCVIAHGWWVAWGLEEEEPSADPGFHPIEEPEEPLTEPLALWPQDLAGVGDEEALSVFRVRLPGRDVHGRIETRNGKQHRQQVQVSRLVVTREEQERFRGWYCGALEEAQGGSADDVPEARFPKRDVTLLKVIGVLAEALTKKKISAAHLAVKIDADKLLEKLPGLSAETLRKRISDGLKEVKRARESFLPE